MTLQEKIDNNVWDNIDDILPVIDDMKNDKWTWTKNFKCKYIELRIDMRDGGCILMDREGNRIEPKDLKRQAKYK